MGKHIILSLLLTFLSFVTLAQSATEKVYETVEEMPEYPGGLDSLLSYLGSAEYPKMAQENDIQGLTYIEFIVDENGNVTNVKVLRSSKHKVLDDAAIQVVKDMPKWKPGKEKGEYVKVLYTVPIQFKFKSPKKK